MYKINIIKADYEGWWLFDEWQDNIIVRYEFLTESEMKEFYHRLIKQMHAHFSSYQVGKYKMVTFFNCCDVRYCDDCDEDLQMYVSPIMTKDHVTITDETYYSIENLINS